MPTPAMQSLPTSLANDDDDALLLTLVVINVDDAVVTGDTVHRLKVER